METAEVNVAESQTQRGCGSSRQESHTLLRGWIQISLKNEKKSLRHQFTTDTSNVLETVDEFAMISDQHLSNDCHK